MSTIRVTREESRTGEQTVIRNGRIEVRWDEQAQIVLLDPREPNTRVTGGPLIELASPSGARRPQTLGLGIDQHDEGVLDPEPMLDNQGAGLLLQRRFPVAVQPLAATWSVRVYEAHAFIGITLTLHNVSAEPVAVRRIFPFVTGSWWGNGTLRVQGRQANFAVYKNGWQSWSYAGGLPPGKRDLRPYVPTNVAWHSPGGVNPRQPVSGVVDVVSEGNGLLGHPEQREALLAGFLSGQDWIGQIYTQREEGAFAASVLLDDYVLAPGASVETPPLLLSLGPQERLLGEYADALAREQHARHTARTYSGWCSWYYYFTDVSEAAILENVGALRTLHATLPLDLVQIDDGYQAAVGDWLSVNGKFPHGMAALAERIRLAGFEPGLWLAPFTVAANSRLAHEHPDWLVRDSRSNRPAVGGKNWDVKLFALDTTHPEARAWLRETLTTIVEQWGYRYLKLDFLASGALKGRRHDPTVTRARALRDGLQLIRETVGEEVYLLGCGCPLLSAVGIVDAMRIGPDSAPYWSPRFKGWPLPQSEGHPLPSHEGALRNTLARAWMHPTLWTNDPDCLLVRDQNTELTLDEVRAFASAVGLTGGMALLSDRVAQLTFERLEIVSKVMPPMRERALPLNYFTHGVPECVTAHITRPWGSWLLVGLFNSASREREIEVRWSDLGLAQGEYHAVEFWSGSYLGLSDSGVSVRVGRHGAAVLAIHASADVPLLLSTSFHISQGAVEITDWSFDASTREIRWHARLGRQVAGTFTLWLPRHLWPQSVSSTGPSVNWHRNPRGEVVVTAEIRDEAWFIMRLESES